MQHNALKNSHARNLHFLKQQIQKLDAGFSQLNRSMGRDGHGLAQSLKTGFKAFTGASYSPTGFVSDSPSSPLSDIWRNNRSINDYLSINTISYKPNNRQIWAEIASGVARAMGRNF